MTGKIHVNKVVGNFHLSPGRSFSKNNVHTHDIVPYLKGTGEEHHDFGHVIHTFEFGAEEEFEVPASSKKGSSPIMGQEAKKRLGIKNPLNGLTAKTSQAEYMFQYFTKVVATEYRPLSGDRISTFQYSATSYERDLRGPMVTSGKAGEVEKASGGSTHAPHQVQHGFMGIPGVFFNYEISPLRTIHTEYRQSFARFLSQLCSIVGGVLTMAGLLDAAVWNWRLRRSAVGSGGHGLGSGSIGGGGGGNAWAGYAGGGKEGLGMAGRGGKLI